MRAWGLKIGFWSLESGVWGFEIGVRVSGCGFRAPVSEFRVSGFGFRVLAGLRVSGEGDGGGCLGGDSLGRGGERRRQCSPGRATSELLGVFFQKIGLVN
jgi:hypothetical protein